MLRNDEDEIVPQTKLFDRNTGVTKAIADGRRAWFALKGKRLKEILSKRADSGWLYLFTAQPTCAVGSA